MNLNYPSVDEYNAQYEMDLAWDALVAGDVAEALAALVRMVGQSDLPGRAPDSFFSSERVKVARYFLTYDYPELQRTTENVKRSFAIVAAWKSLLSQFQIQYQPRKEAWDKAEPVATILGTGYILDIDVEAICEAIYGEDGKYVAQHQSLHPVPSYAQRAELLPDLPSLLPLSLTARTAFVRAAQFANQSGLAERQRIGPLNASELELGLNELAKAGLIDLDPGTTDLLMNFTLKDLKQFAFEHNVKSHGPKYRLIQAIVAQAGQEEIKKLLLLLGAKRYVRPLVANLPLLQKHVVAESSRVGWYLKWIEQVLCLSHTPPKLQTVQWPPPDRDMKPWVRISENPTAYLREPWNHTEVELVRTIWDSKCDEIVRNLADKYAWDAPLYISDAIVAYLPSEKLDSFKRACEEDKTHVWYNVLMYYGEARLAEMSVETRQPRLLRCADCGKQFLEWSIHMSLARRVGYKILFCGDCYASSLDGVGRDAISMSHDDVLGRLAELAVALESVPSATFVQRPNLAALPEEKQTAIVKSLLAMPSYKTYVDTFGSWLKALILAGVLEDGTQRLQRGTHCIAVDGHECHSLGEKTIDDWLNANGIPHDKEPLYPHHIYFNPSGKMRADWKVRESLIEYAGLMDEPEYFAKIEAKQEFATKLGFPLIVIEPGDVLNLDGKLGHLVDTT